MRIAVRGVAVLVGTGLGVLGVAGCSGDGSAGPTPALTASASGPAATATASGVPSGSTKPTGPSPRDSTKPAVNLNQTAQAGGVVASVVGLRAITAKAKVPGEISGPAVAVTVRVSNDSKQALDLSAVLVTLYDSKKAPGGEMTGPPAAPMSGKLEPGRVATGVYVFTVPLNRRARVTINIALPTESPVLAFQGKAPSA